MIKSLTILGSTGSIGLQAIDVCRFHNIEIVALSAYKNIDIIKEQIVEFGVKLVAIIDEKAAATLRDFIEVKGLECRVFSGERAIKELLQIDGAEMVLNAISGMAGLLPSFWAINSFRDIALANKETLVGAGAQIIDLAKKNNVKIYPVDSEHSAIFQCMRSFRDKSVKKLFITCSGGPFRTWEKDDIKVAKASQALKHPTWDMGKKITIDSATLMNKGLELIEACHLFGVAMTDIDVVIHPESIVHSAVLYTDGSCIAQLGFADMRIPIQYALGRSERNNCPTEPFSFFDERARSLNFAEVDADKFPMLNLAKEAYESSVYAALILNAANEVAVEAYLADEISFYQIFELCKATLDEYESEALDSYIDAEEIMILEQKYRSYAYKLKIKLTKENV